MEHCTKCNKEIKPNRFLIEGEFACMTCYEESARAYSCKEYKKAEQFKCIKCKKDFKSMKFATYCPDCLNIDVGPGKIVDMINEPPHYTKGGIQPIDFITANNLDFCEGNIIKYVTRHKSKNGLEDLEKARFYLNKLIKNYENPKI